MFATACGILLLGFPVAFTLAGTAIGFAGLGWLLGVFDFSFMGALASRYFGVMVNELLVAVPLFVFMGVMLERSKIAEQLLETMGLLFGSLRGGLGLSVIFVGMLLAASTGIVGATVVTMGLLSLPSMLKAGYDPARRQHGSATRARQLRTGPGFGHRSLRRRVPARRHAGWPLYGLGCVQGDQGAGELPTHRPPRGRGRGVGRAGAAHPRSAGGSYGAGPGFHSDRCRHAHRGGGDGLDRCHFARRTGR
jgi:hypothetical protein